MWQIALALLAYGALCVALGFCIGWWARDRRAKRLAIGGEKR